LLVDWVWLDVLRPIGCLLMPTVRVIEIDCVLMPISTVPKIEISNVWMNHALMLC